MMRMMGASDEIKEMLGEQSQGMIAIQETFLHNPGLSNALKVKDRKRLLATCKDVFDPLHKQHGITHFYFHGPDRVNLLRVHKPEKYGDRILNSTLAESGILGVCIGAALAGKRPIGEIQFNDFIATGFNPLVNGAAKIRYRWGGSGADR